MAKDFEVRSDLHSDTTDTICGIMKGINSDLASNNGVDLNAKDEGKRNSVAKAAFMVYPPPPPLPDVPAIIEVMPEAPKSPYNNIFDFLEELGGGFKDAQNRRNQQAQNEELANALNETVLADHNDPPKESTGTNDDLNKGE